MHVLATIVRPKGRAHIKKPKHWSDRDRNFSSTNISHSGYHPKYESFCEKNQWVAGKGWIPKEQAGKIPDGNLENEVYRFWIGMPEPKAPWSKCRFCSAVCFSPAERRAHQEGSQCCRNLVEMYKIALECNALNCVVCGLYCYRGKMWGVPLCDPPNSQCIRDFKFQQHQTTAFLDLKRKALCRGKLSK